MGWEEKYLIGERFLVERCLFGYLSVKDSKGELNKIFRLEQISPWLIDVYKGDDVYWIFNRVPLVSSEKGLGNVVIKGNEVVSYSVLRENEFYIKHSGQEFRGRIEVGKRREILIGEKDLKVKKEGKDTVKLEYTFLGDKATPMIEIIGETSEVACFPEFNKVYSSIFYVWNCWECLNVGVFKNQTLYFYVLFGNGEEYLVYEGSHSNPFLENLPMLHKIENIMVVNFYGGENEKGNGVVRNLKRIPGFYYLYVKEDPEGDLYISFNLKRWKKIEQANKLIFKGGAENLEGYPIGFQEYYSIDAIKKFAKKLSSHQERLPLPAF